MLLCAFDCDGSIGDPFTVQTANAFDCDGSLGHVALALPTLLFFYSAGKLFFLLCW